MEAEKDEEKKIQAARKLESWTKALKEVADLKGKDIIITTKDASLTEKCALFRMECPPNHTKLALEGLSGTDSLRLLCWHAFGCYAPKEGYEVEAIRASKYCDRHPLALKVLGSSLINEDVATWSHTFRMLETTEFQDKGTTKIQGLVLDMKMLQKGRMRGSSIGIDHIFQSHDLIMNFGAGLPVDRVPEFSSSRFKNIKLRTNHLGSLKYLNLSYCKLVTVGGFKGLPALKTLKL
nr:Toll/interleukin-1 receptor (TIR) domain-containing protein [Tanacetum cinerariifolium]